MGEHTHPPPAATPARAETGQDTLDAARELLLMHAGGRLFAVYADEAEGVAECPVPTPLPHAPRSVLGVVCVRGRMRTVLDPPALTGDAPTTQQQAATPPRLVVTLRGDEQLALAADKVERVPAPPALTPSQPAATSDRPQANATRATLEHEGRPVSLLDPTSIFDAAMHGAERRRQRGKV